MSCPPPPPPPPQPAFSSTHASKLRPPTVPKDGPPKAFLVELLKYNGYPFMDHWAYFVQSHHSSSIGVRIHATGAVNVGFELEIQRMHNVETYEDKLYKRVPLQWVEGAHFDEVAMFNRFEPEMRIDTRPVCPFETCVFKVPAPGKSLNTVESNISHETTKNMKVVQRNCQTWIVESADQLVSDGVFEKEVAAYLRAAQQ